MKKRNSATLVLVIVLLCFSFGCSTSRVSSSPIAELDLPSTDAERANVDFLARSYELEGLDPAVARVKALRAWNQSRGEAEDDEEYSIRLFPETNRDRRDVDRLAKKYEERGYDPAKARAKALDSWRNQNGVKLKIKLW